MKGGIEELVARKRAGKPLRKSEIEDLVSAYSAGELDDDDVAPWLHAVMESGMSLPETVTLTDAMARSGTSLEWGDVVGTVVDKHSTGGVGDAVSLIAVPLAAACGARVAKLSGRALGHTGGTLDKLERIPGLRTDLSVHAFKTQVGEVGCAIAGTSDRLAPADKKMYALRHRTQTVASIPLIAASVLAKKIAGGAPTLVIDVKAGRCAFMHDVASARQLAETIAQVGAMLGRTMRVFVTDMDTPLAVSVGDTLELDEALGVLSGHDRGKLAGVALAIAAAMIAGHHAGDDEIESRALAAARLALRDGTARVRLDAMARAQGGELEAFRRPGEPQLVIAAGRDGVVADIDGRTIAEAVSAAQAKDNRCVGVRFPKSLGETVRKGEPLIEVFGETAAPELADRVRETVRIADGAPARGPLILERIHLDPTA